MTQVPTPAGSPPTVDGRNEQDFARIWGRVMPLEQAGCPHPGGASAGGIALRPAPGARRHVLLHPAVPEVPTPLPCPREAPPPSRAHISPPRSRMSPSRIGFRHLREQLQMYIDQEAADWRTYLSLSRRSPGGCTGTGRYGGGRTPPRKTPLGGLLSLISGVRYFPSESLSAHAPGCTACGFAAVLCRAAGALAYLAAAEECSDPALRALYQELAGMRPVTPSFCGSWWRSSESAHNSGQARPLAAPARFFLLCS